MRQEPSTAHIPPEELADYFDAALSEGWESEIEEHLAECTTCTEEARRLHTFSRVWDHWTARAHGEAYQQALLVGALQQAQEDVENHGWRERLSQWRQDVVNKASTALHRVVQASESASQLVTEGLDALGRTLETLQPAPVPVRVRTRGGRVRGAVASPTTVLLTPEIPQTRITVGGERRAVVVRVDGYPAPHRPPLVLLIPMHEDRKPQVQESQKPLREAYLMAQFRAVEPGDYLVIFEPTC